MCPHVRRCRLASPRHLTSARTQAKRPCPNSDLGLGFCFLILDIYLGLGLVLGTFGPYSFGLMKQACWARQNGLVDWIDPVNVLHTMVVTWLMSQSKCSISRKLFRSPFEFKRHHLNADPKNLLGNHRLFMSGVITDSRVLNGQCWSRDQSV